MPRKNPRSPAVVSPGTRVATRCRGWFWVLVACAALLGGCGEEKIEVVVVAGQVTIAGEPAPAGSQVNFMNVDTGLTIWAPVDEQGHYEVDMAAGPGLPPGTYKVSLTPPPDAPTVPMQYPAEYRDPETSGWVLELTAAGNPAYDLAIPE